MRRSLGQNFLGDTNILRKIIEVVPKTLPVLEIGTGSGILTKGLAQAIPFPIISYEIDQDTHEGALSDLSHFDHVQLIHSDFLKVEIPFSNPFVVIANIPYYITSPIVEKCIGNSWVRGIFIMVQKEIANRMVAKPGEKDYSSFSVFCQTRAVVRKCFPVSRHCFFPTPRVDSAFVEMIPTPYWTDQINQIGTYDKVVHSAFWGKRKTIASCLSRSPYLALGVPNAKKILTISGIDPQQRGERLSVEEYVRLSNALVELKIPVLGQPT
jgi:16S rRNA (adenine1518-N6/adenine1519-N6)-dimethyltransferase